jgi:hypothetical protein
VITTTTPRGGQVVVDSQWVPAKKTLVITFEDRALGWRDSVAEDVGDVTADVIAREVGARWGGAIRYAWLRKRLAAQIVEMTRATSPDDKLERAAKALAQSAAMSVPVDPAIAAILEARFGVLQAHEHG